MKPTTGRHLGRLGLGLVGVALSMAAPAWAHHSFAMFDRDKEVAMTGTVHQFRWTSPHSWMQIEAPNGKGGADMWDFELNSPSNLARQGWRPDWLRPGQKVTVVFNPLRNGERGGLFLEATRVDGKTMSDHFITRLPTQTHAPPPLATPKQPQAN